MSEKILVVDDEKEIADLLEVYLKNEGYTVFKFYNGRDALKCIEEVDIDLAILDITLPDIDGFCICRKIREKYYFPVIMLTAKMEDSDKIMGLTIGADDYMIKPFNPLEAVARVKTQLRRCQHYNKPIQAQDAEADEYDIRGLIINKDSHKCFLFGKEDENNVKRNVLVFIALSTTFLIGMAVCAICDFAITKTLTWSLIPISSIIFTWMTASPVIMFGRKGIVGSLLSISILTIPYLYVLSNIVNAKSVFSIGCIMAIISIIYLWIIFVVFNKLKTRKWLAGGIIATLSIPIMIIINVVLSRILSEPAFDVWDGLSVFLILIAAIVLFSCGYIKKLKED